MNPPSPPSAAAPERVVLLDPGGRPIGHRAKADVHSSSTPLHLAFSLHLFGADGRVLITRRALSKATWPGVWTNSCCGHPDVGEEIEDAVARRLDTELGVAVTDLTCVLPDFAYTARDASGVQENEVCPVYAGRLHPGSVIRANSAEVMDWVWVEWADLRTAVVATPFAFSPWAAEQVRRLPGVAVPVTSSAEHEVDRARERHLTSSDAPTEATTTRSARRSGSRRGVHPQSPSSGARVLPLPQPGLGPDVAEHLDLVDGLLTEALADLRHLWTTKLEDAARADILGDQDLPDLLDQLIRSGGKRIRPVMAYLGWLTASGRARGIGHADVVRAGAALELLHLFALVHDDVMDESASRRGLPTVHTQADQLHRDADGRGSAARFGESIAILLGDLAHAEADQLAADLPPEMRKVWRLLVVELVYGQRRDLTGSAAGRRDLANARAIARLKSGGYTVERPLELGAAAARAPEVVADRLASYGREVGEAFALRDDLLGVWGDPVRTGKPAGDDLVSGKPTVIISLAERRLTGPARRALNRIGSPALTPDEVVLLQEEMATRGVVAEVESMITAHIGSALQALEEPALDPVGVRELTQMAYAIAWRDA